MHKEQKVCEHDVIMGVSKKSLHTWQRSAASTVLSRVTGVFNQSEGSGTSKELSMGSLQLGMLSCDLRSVTSKSVERFPSFNSINDRRRVA